MEWVEIQKKIVEIIHCLTKEQVFHRDIKSENIMVRYKDGIITPVLIDFGVSTYGIDYIAEPTGCTFSNTELARREKFLVRRDLFAAMSMATAFPMPSLKQYCQQYCNLQYFDRPMHSTVLSELKLLECEKESDILIPTGREIQPENLLIAASDEEEECWT